MTNRLELRRRETTAFRLTYAPDRRRLKRVERIALGEDHVYIAYTWGEAQAYRRNPIANPYPPGLRHDAFDRGMANADPMGSHHGTNI